MQQAIYILSCAGLALGLMAVEYDHHRTNAGHAETAKRLTDARAELSRCRTLVKLAFNLDSAESVAIWTTPVTVSAYTARAQECDATPEVTADMTPSRVGVLAVSRDMIEVFGLTYGEMVLLVDPELGTLGVFQVRDLMAPRWTKRVDILHGNLKAARKFGTREGVRLVRVLEGA